MTDISVTVVSYGRKHLYAVYTDPVTGKKHARSTRTANQRKADRFAATWEAELQAGSYRHVGRITWAEFREQYESYMQEHRSDSTLEKVWGVFNTVERIINPHYLAALQNQQLHQIVERLRDEKKATATIASYLRTLKAALRWAAKDEQRFLLRVPTIPTVAVKRGGKRIKQTKSGGRAITGEEFDRMLKSVPKIVGEDRAASWQWLLRGLWWSGLRISEAIALRWDAGNHPHPIDLDDLPLLIIPAEFQKKGKDTKSPMTLEFAEMLRSVPIDQRTGYVFNPAARTSTGRAGLNTAKRKISDVGRIAGVKVKDMHSGKTKFATAQDFRRACATRLIHRVEPLVLKEIMRHETLETTLAYYADLDPKKLAKSLEAAYRNTSATFGGSTAETQNSESTQVVDTEMAEAGIEPARPFRDTGF